MSDTPRTNAKAPVTIYDSGGQEYTADLVPAQLCRQIERELNAVKAENKAMRELINSAAIQLSGFLGFYSDELTITQIRSVSECLGKLQSHLK